MILARAVEPPIVFDWAPFLIETPSSPLPMSSEPVESVPMRFPDTVLKLVPGSLSVTPESAVGADHVRLVRRAGVAGVDANPVRLGAIRDPDPVIAVPQRVRAGDVDADQVAGDDVEVGPGPADAHPLIGVAGDDVSLGGVAIAVAVGADHVRLGAVLDEDPDAAIAER